MALIKILFISATFLLLQPISIISQHCFVFESLDNNIIEFWLLSKNESPVSAKSFESLREVWTAHKPLILNSNIGYLDTRKFIESQESRLDLIERAIERKQQDIQVKETFLLLTEFSEMRTCFCNSNYILDELINTQNSYSTIHDIIHDELLGLYEWNEFTWYIDHFKESVNALENRIKSSTPSSDLLKYQNNLIEIRDCLRALEYELEVADRKKFEAPCLQINKALEGFFREFIQSDGDT